MKTPHTIRIFVDDVITQYDWITGEHIEQESDYLDVPCLANFMTKSRQFEEYGTREHEIIIVRFTSPVPDFKRAEFNGNTYRLYEQTYIPDKSAYRLQKVVD